MATGISIMISITSVKLTNSFLGSLTFQIKMAKSKRVSDETGGLQKRVYRNKWLTSPKEKTQRSNDKRKPIEAYTYGTPD